MSLSAFRLYIRILFLLLVSCGCCQETHARKEKKTEKKVLPVAAAMPVPDPVVSVPRNHSNLAPVPEYNLLSDADYLLREGIDVSHYQGDIDWSEVAKQGDVSYVYIKATEGASLVDDRYEYNIAEARKYGLKVGSYHFFRGNVSVEEQIANMVSTVRKDRQDLIPIVDVEHTNGVSSSVFLSRLHQFMEAVRKHYGVSPMLYTFVNFYNKHLHGNGFDGYPLMIAFYRDDQPLLNDERPYAIWQYTARGRIPGIRGNVDRSKFMDGFTISDISF
jgi:lysozyme